MVVLGSIVDYHNPSQTNGGKREGFEVADPRTWNVSRRYLGWVGGEGGGRQRTCSGEESSLLVRWRDDEPTTTGERE